MSVGRVLVVDDEPAIRALVAKVVQRSGLSVDIAADGEEAIAKMESGHYDVLVVDLMMPKVDGSGVVEYVKQMKGRRPTVIVVSAGDSPTLHRLDSSVVHSILRKPFEIDVLGDLVVAAAQSVREEEDKESSSIVPFRNKR
jgi:osomolarity two-component system, response regulator SKN7